MGGCHCAVNGRSVIVHAVSATWKSEEEVGHVASLKQLVKLDCEQKDLARHASQRNGQEEPKAKQKGRRVRDSRARATVVAITDPNLFAVGAQRKSMCIK